MKDFIEVTYNCSGKFILIGRATITDIREERGLVIISTNNTHYPSAFTVTETYEQVKELLA